MRERSQYYKKNDIQVSIGKLSKIIYGSKNSNLYVKTYVAHFRNHYQKSNFKYSSSYLSVSQVLDSRRKTVNVFLVYMFPARILRRTLL